MKTAYILCLAIAVLAAGCGGNAPTNAPANSSVQTNAAPSGGSLVTAPVDYLGAVAKAQQNSVKTVDVAAVSQAIRQFQVEQGRLPKDLEELVQEKYLPRIPPTPFGTKFVYDPATGEAKVVKL
jgi:hypothetical protein